MVEAYLRRTPLAHRGLAAKAAADASGADIVMGEAPHRCQINLRGNADDGRFTEALHSVTGLRLPAEANSFSTEGTLACLWLGPDEWLILGRPGDGAAIASELRDALAGVHHSVVDVGANRVALELSGLRSKEVLSKGCSLDLDPRGGWAAGRCAQTLLARVPVILQERADTTGILVRPSFAEYLVDWLIDAAAQ
jgi:sarcosine oxidase subunit gamma